MTPSIRAAGGADEVRLLSALLAAEHAAVYGYGVLGARLSGALLLQARAFYDAHRSRRDELTGLLRDRGADPPAAQAAYDLTTVGPGPAVAVAVRLEEGLAVRWRDLVAGTDDRDLRALGVSGLTGCAVRAARWRSATMLGPPTVALPGSG